MLLVLCFEKVWTDNKQQLASLNADLCCSKKTEQVFFSLNISVSSSSSSLFYINTPCQKWLTRISMQAWLGRFTKFSSPSPKQDVAQEDNRNIEWLHHCLLVGNWSKNFTPDILPVIILSLLALSSTWNPWNMVSLL